MNRLVIILIGALFSVNCFADIPNLPAVTLTTNVDGSQTYSLSLQILILMTIFSLLPAIFIMMTSFTRIIIVLAIVRQAIGMPQTPTNQILIGISLFLSFFIMSPIFNQINTNAIQPYLNKKINQEQAFNAAQKPFKKFMLSQTRTTDLNLFKKISSAKEINNNEEINLSVLIPAFVVSELKTAFQMGFLIFIPFLIIDIVVASILMAMGMMMLSPLVISLPFKIMLFVLVDGWALLIGTLISSFGSL